MMSVQPSIPLLLHLQSFEMDGATVASSLFDGGRLSYPERRRMEHELGFIEPYALEHESRTLEGMSVQWNAACRFLARIATRWASDIDPTLDLLWGSHDAFAHLTKDAEAQALDRLIAALVTVERTRHLVVSDVTENGKPTNVLIRACEVLIRGLQANGFPPSGLALEEICDGAMPACIGLGMIDVDWKDTI